MPTIMTDTFYGVIDGPSALAPESELLMSIRELKASPTACSYLVQMEIHRAQQALRYRARNQARNHNPPVQLP